MAKTTLFKGVVYLSDEQYAKLIADGVIEVGGQTITYDESMVYVTPKTLGGDYYTKSEVEEKLKTVFDNVTYLDNSYGEQSVLYDTDDGITIMQTARFVSGDKTSDISSEITIPLVGSDEIVFDATEDGSHIQAHLDMDITNKLARTLVTPLSIPSNTELVAVDNTNSQTMLAIGDGLSVENGTLSASGGSGGKLYRHQIHISSVCFTVYSSQSETYTLSTISNYIYNKSLKIKAFDTSSSLDQTVYISGFSNSILQIHTKKINIDFDNKSVSISTSSSRPVGASVTDYVTEL